MIIKPNTNAWIWYLIINNVELILPPDKTHLCDKESLEKRYSAYLKAG
jgi:hypothetical protein